MFALYNLTQIFRKNSSRVIEEFSITPFSRIHRSRQSVRNIMVSFSIWILLTLQYLSSRNALIILRIVASAVCTLVNSLRFSTNFVATEPDVLLPLPYRTIAAGYSVISIIEINIFFSR